MPSSTAEQPTSTSRRVWQLAWPTILSNLLFTTVGFVHIKIVTELGTNAVAAVTTGHRVFFLVQAILMGVSVAATALIARAWGAQNVDRAEIVAWTSMALSLGLAFFLGLPLLFIPATLASLFGLDAESTRLAASFIFWLGVFNMFSAVNLILSTALRATGDVISPLWFLFYSSCLNVLLAWTLAYGKFGLPQFGVAGVSAGGGFAGAVITVIFTTLWWRGRFNLKPLKRPHVDWKVARQMVTIGTPAVVEQGIVQLAFLAFFAIVAQYGTEAYAAYGIGISLISFSIVIGFGFGIASATLVGQQLGAGNNELATAAGWRGLRMALIAMLALSVLLVIYARELATFMIDDPDVIELMVVFLYMIAACQPMMAVEATLAGALRGAGDTRFPLIATFCGILGGRLLPAFIFLKLGLSVYWIFAVMIIDYSTKACLLLHRYRSGKWQHIRLTTREGASVDSDKKNT